MRRRYELARKAVERGTMSREIRRAMRGLEIAGDPGQAPDEAGKRSRKNAKRARGQ